MMFIIFNGIVYYHGVSQKLSQGLDVAMPRN